MTTPNTQTAKANNQNTQAPAADYLEELDFMNRRECWRRATVEANATKS